MPADLPEYGAPCLRTVLDGVCAGQTPTAAEWLRWKELTVDLVALLVQALQGSRDLWSPINGRRRKT